MSRTPEQNRAYMRHYYATYRRPALGRKPLVNADLIRAHITACTNAGMTTRQLAITAGVSEEVVYRVARGTTQGVRHHIATAILNVRPRTITSIGITRRVRALAALGWSVTQIANTAGVNVDTVKDYRAGGRTLVKPAALNLVNAYNELSMRTPPQGNRYEKAAVNGTKNRARRNGWVPPLAWDDDTIDHPDATPAATNNPHGFDMDDLILLVHAGETWENLTRRLGVTRSSIERRLQREGRTDILRTLADRNLPLALAAQEAGRWRGVETRWGAAS